MPMRDQAERQASDTPSGDATPPRTEAFFFGGLAILGLLLLGYEHRTHLLEWLPWTLLVACPLIHLFMHRGHRHHKNTPERRERD